MIFVAENISLAWLAFVALYSFTNYYERNRG